MQRQVIVYYPLEFFMLGTASSFVIAILCVPYRMQNVSGVRALSPMEWARFAAWLRSEGKAPEQLLDTSVVEVLGGFRDTTVTVERITVLLQRRVALMEALQHWEQAGVWLLTRADPYYPHLLREKLGPKAPPAIFAIGHKGVLGHSGIAVVGARDALPDDLQLARDLGRAITVSNVAVVSGGARGVDEAAMTAALDANGVGMAFLAGSLLQVSSRPVYRQAIAQGRLIFLSVPHPEAGFETGNALARNRYIYCLSDAAVAIRPGDEKGGTWHGASDAIRNGFCPVWTMPDATTGSKKLLAAGALPLHWPMPIAELRRQQKAIQLSL